MFVFYVFIAASSLPGSFFLTIRLIIHVFWTKVHFGPVNIQVRDSYFCLLNEFQLFSSLSSADKPDKKRRQNESSTKWLAESRDVCLLPLLQKYISKTSRCFQAFSVIRITLWLPVTWIGFTRTVWFDSWEFVTIIDLANFVRRAGVLFLKGFCIWFLNG